MRFADKTLMKNIGHDIQNCQVCQCLYQLCQLVLKNEPFTYNIRQILENMKEKYQSVSKYGVEPTK